jgi:hypothetical protein
MISITCKASNIGIFLLICLSSFPILSVDGAVIDSLLSEILPVATAFRDSVTSASKGATNAFSMARPDTTARVTSTERVMCTMRRWGKAVEGRTNASGAEQGGE